MSANFYNYIQPSIIKCGNTENIPEHLRCKYMLNINAMSIRWFVDNFMLIENPETGQYMYMLTHDGEKIRLNETEESDVLDIPRAFIVLTDEFITNQNNFRDWIIASFADPATFGKGTENFKLGVDYYINRTLYDYLSEFEDTLVGELSEEYVMPNYLNTGFNVTEDYIILDDSTISYNNYKYFYLKNKLSELTYSEDELSNFYSTFFSIIAFFAVLSDSDALKTNNQIYKKVIDYYKNFQVDDTLISLELLLNNKISKIIPEYLSSCCSNQQTSSNQSSQINQSQLNQSQYVSTSCSDIYKNAMYEYLLNMLSNTEFYKDWMYIENPEGEKIVNDSLVEALITLLTEFEEVGYDLSFADKYLIHGNCCKDNQYTANNEKNHTIIQNYIKLLQYVLTGCIDDNANKISVYGRKFAELLPKLSF